MFVSLEVEMLYSGTLQSVKLKLNDLPSCLAVRNRKSHFRVYVPDNVLCLMKKKLVRKRKVRLLKRLSKCEELSLHLLKQLNPKYQRNN